MKIQPYFPILCSLNWENNRGKGIFFCIHFFVCFKTEKSLLAYQTNTLFICRGDLLKHFKGSQRVEEVTVELGVKEPEKTEIHFYLNCIAAAHWTQNSQVLSWSWGRIRAMKKKNQGISSPCMLLFFLPALMGTFVPSAC